MANVPTVTLVSECFIRPKYEVEDATKPIYLAPMELSCLTVHYNQRGLLFSTSDTTQTMPRLLDNLKHSLSIALVHFYPLAGQLETQVDEAQHNSCVFINCNKGPGAKFVHATTGMRVCDIMSPRYVPDVAQSSFFEHPAMNYQGHTRPLLAIQVTELADGVFIGCSMNHAVADGTSFWHFFNAWSEIFRGNKISRPPIHKRWFIDGTGPRIKIPYTKRDEYMSAAFEPPKLKARFFRFSAESIAKLKAKANADCGGINNKNTISSFQALSGLVWRGILRARHPQEDAETKCKFHVNCRSRVVPPLSQNYFGELVQTTQGRCKAGELLSKDLGWAALLLNRAVAGHTDKEVRRVVEEWMRSPDFINLGTVSDPYCIVIGSSPRFDMYGTEFGMGKAVGVISGYGNKLDGKVTCYPGRQGGGSIDVEIYLEYQTMCALESDQEFMAWLQS